jgi:lipoate-protein ligase A
LHDLGIEALFSGRNDITIDGKKFSGNAQHVYKNRLLHHGTLLFSGNLTDLSSALKPDPLKFQDKSVKSVASRVTNIGSHIKMPMTVLEFKAFLTQHVRNAYGITQTYEFSQNELAEINKISSGKYACWDWNFGHSPTYSFSNTKRFQGGMVQFNLDIDKGMIKDFKLYGDFFGELDIADLENKLKGLRYDETDVQKALVQLDIQKYLNNITLDEFLLGMFNSSKE